MRELHPTTKKSAESDKQTRLIELCQRALNGRRLMLVSNRGPVEHVVSASGEIKAHRGSGGVVTALAGLSQYVDLTWIAATMTEGDRRVASGVASVETPMPSGFTLRYVTIPEKVYHRFYNVFSNPLLWFLQHYMLDSTYGSASDSTSRNAWERGYVLANRAFAEALKSETEKLATTPVVMLQDYQLYLVAGFARELGVQAVFQHFIHIPWPASSYWKFLQQDIRQAICAGVAANDIAGFQTPVDVRHFLNCCEDFLDDVQVDYDAQTVRTGNHVCHARCYPISIDVEALRRTAASRSVRRYRELLKQRTGHQTIVRVDRLEPTKNILRGFEAFESLLERRPDYIGHVKFLAFLVPSRARIAEYQRYRKAVFEAIERINGRFAQPDWRPIELFYENNYHQAIAGMSLADVLIVNPFMDGMNLVAKEGVIVNERNGVLILSEGAGAHHQLGEGALSVASGDIEGTAEALLEALTMPEEDRIVRLRRLKQLVEDEDLSWWVRRQVEDIAEIEAELSTSIDSTLAVS